MLARGLSGSCTDYADFRRLIPQPGCAWRGTAVGHREIPFHDVHDVLYGTLSGFVASSGRAPGYGFAEPWAALHNAICVGSRPGRDSLSVLGAAVVNQPLLHNGR